MDNKRTFLILLSMGAYCCAAPLATAGQQDATVPQPAAREVAAPQAVAPSGAPLRLTLQDALDRARKNSVPFQSALTDAGLAREDRAQARDALLPSVNYNNQAIITQGTGANLAATSPGATIFIAANGTHEYLSQANVHEAFDLASFSNYRRLAAVAAAARARQEIASRGLVVTVVQNYYAAAAAQQKLESAQKTAEEGTRFFKLTQDLEKGGEVAHSDVIKAELQMQERNRQLREAQLARLNSRLGLAVLIFSDFNDNYELADDLHAAVPLPPFAEFRQQAVHDNPDVRAALSTVQAANRDVFGARAGYFPSLTLDYFYGIDAAHFAVNTATPSGKFSNLGSAVTATVVIPIWNWGATQSRVRQANLRRSLVKKELSFAQRKLLADIQSVYDEADAALTELGGLSRSAELAAESLRLITLRYKDGEATVLEVVDAQTTFAAASNAYQDGAVRYRVALASLQTLTGVLTTP